MATKTEIKNLSLEQLKQCLADFETVKGTVSSAVYEKYIKPDVEAIEKRIAKLTPKPKAERYVQISFKQKHQSFIDSITEQTNLIKQYVALVQSKVDEYNKTQGEPISVVFDPDTGEIRLKARRQRRKTDEVGEIVPTREQLVQTICREGPAKMNPDGTPLRDENGKVVRTGGELKYEELGKKSPGLTAKQIEDFWRKETKTPITTSFSMNYREFLQKISGEDDKARYVTFEHHEKMKQE